MLQRNNTSHTLFFVNALWSWIGYTENHGEHLTLVSKGRVCWYDQFTIRIPFTWMGNPWCSSWHNTGGKKVACHFLTSKVRIGSNEIEQICIKYMMKSTRFFRIHFWRRFDPLSEHTLKDCGTHQRCSPCFPGKKYSWPVLFFMFRCLPAFQVLLLLLEKMHLNNICTVPRHCISTRLFVHYFLKNVCLHRGDFLYV